MWCSCTRSCLNVVSSGEYLGEGRRAEYAGTVAMNVDSRHPSNMYGRLGDIPEMAVPVNNVRTFLSLSLLVQIQTQTHASYLHFLPMCCFRKYSCRWCGPKEKSKMFRLTQMWKRKETIQYMFLGGVKKSRCKEMCMNRIGIGKLIASIRRETDKTNP